MKNECVTEPRVDMRVVVEQRIYRGRPRSKIQDQAVHESWIRRHHPSRRRGPFAKCNSHIVNVLVNVFTAKASSFP